MSYTELDGMKDMIRISKETLTKGYDFVRGKNKEVALVAISALGQISREEAIEAIKKDFCEGMDKYK